ncbi:5-bromo-4-chloroindolyl phosphate hydrolysis family protein [Scatolibacter rhodanostii]|uniref:5-bromo-4-chloroindolyl phosphate hydrolysis family protein n=1 Tax=Scatolibacter rhodanostii TaxID=2014781 RepID=UPI000C083499|nr:5-bromo-4-chloroindolyl phosphate hydrolysis family protein [Scatolibacter rhodanostii]
MNSKFPKSVEEQFRSSQINKTLSGAGEVSKQVARSIEKVSAVIDSTIQTVDQSIGREFGSRAKQAANNQYEPQQRPPVNQGQPRPYYKAPVPPKPPKAPKPPKPPRYVPPSRPAYAGRPVPPPSQFKHKGQNNMPIPGPGQHVEQIKKTNIMKYVITVIAAISYATSGNLYDVSDFVGYAIMMAVVYWVSGLIFKDKTQYMLVDDVAKEAEPEKPKAEPKKKVSKTGDPVADELIDEGYEMLDTITKLGVGIRDESIRDCVNRMDTAFKGILEYVTSNPKKVSQVRRFMNYYLPTSIKLLQTYQRLDRQAVKGENITTSMEDIDRFMYTVADAFEKQLDSLFSDDAMDISADISVFETMLKQEGLQEEELKMNFKE